MDCGLRRICKGVSNYASFRLQFIYLSYRDTFIYEYVGDVVNPASFKKRMRDYATEGIQHFYFMMLQKDEVGIRHYFLLVRHCNAPGLSSSLTRPRAVASVVLRIIVANQIATLPNGLLGSTFVWGSLLNGT